MKRTPPRPCRSRQTRCACSQTAPCPPVNWRRCRASREKRRRWQPAYSCGQDSAFSARAVLSPSAGAEAMPSSSTGRSRPGSRRASCAPSSKRSSTAGDSPKVSFLLPGAGAARPLPCPDPSHPRRPPRRAALAADGAPSRRLAGRRLVGSPPRAVTPDRHGCVQVGLVLEIVVSAVADDFALVHFDPTTASTLNQ